MIAVLGDDDQCYALVPDGPGAWTGHSFDSVRAIYDRAANLREIAAHFGVGTVLARRLLNLVGIDYVGDWHRSHRRGVACEELARAHGLAVATLRRLFRHRGLPVNRGRPRRRFSQAELARAALKTKSVNGSAKTLAIHWATASKLLLGLGLFRRNGRRYELISPLSPSGGWCERKRL